MKIEQFLNENTNWQEILSQPPYSIEIKTDGSYVLLAYNMLASDLSNEIVQQCRGSIFYCQDGKWLCVCRPFRKFFNVQEENASSIDWTTARVMEKVDGSLMKCWYHNGWHLSTNNSIDAFKCDCAGVTTFGELFERAAGCCLADFCQNFDIDYTYLFELTSPESRLVIDYADGVWCLTKKHTQYEYEKDFIDDDFTGCAYVKYPTIFPLNTLNECMRVVEVMDKNQEGFVACDARGNRIKIKSPEWCIAHKLFNNNTFSVYNTIEMIKNGTVDDYISYVPQFKKYINEVQEFIKECISECRETWAAVAELAGDRKALAANLRGKRWSDYCFCHITSGITAEDYILKRMKTCNLWDLWKERNK